MGEHALFFFCRKGKSLSKSLVLLVLLEVEEEEEKESFLKLSKKNKEKKTPRSSRRDAGSVSFMKQGRIKKRG